MEIRYKKLSERAFDVKLSKYDTDAGIDLSASEDVEWKNEGEDHYFAIIKTDIGIEIPKNYWLMTATRSSALFNKHIKIQVSVIDTGYTNEITFLAFFNGETPPEIKRGDRVGQIIYVPIQYVTKLSQVDKLPRHSDRNKQGFGSSGIGVEK